MNKRQLTQDELSSLAYYRQWDKMKKTTPGAEHHLMAHVGYGAIERGRELAKEIETVPTDQETVTAVQIAAAAALTKPPTGAPPAPSPAA